ncbi:venom serine protease-like [Zootermopsis nevadensis]|uniref:Proclotting enzyme n=1 Tax=Zootermopsis nevadensis TaxID=136037 RepID=A0A067RES8_ZOONE|nr:venom serine protease-like [Zootermopsis nevadensis]KDR21543.1 Proclotting enzyme [Zootermopsis nevadensis]
MRLSSFLILCGTALLADADTTSNNCDYYQDVAVGRKYQVYSPNYPLSYPTGIDCRWEAIAPSTYNLILDCSISIPRSDKCVEDRFSVSPRGRANLSDAHVYCGAGTFSVETVGNRIVVALHVSRFSSGGKFLCTVTTTSLPRRQNCTCGLKKEYRIVNGHETGVNEYPMMAGLVDFRLKDVFCGATVIATRYCLTASHCLVNRPTEYTGVLIGDHDISIGNETNSTRLLNTESFRSHPLYDSVTQANDIAVIRVAQDILFGPEVGPACLPYLYPATNAGTVVDVLGWGTIEHAGEKSDRLLETQLDVISINTCREVFGSKVSLVNQLCTFRNGTDACQADSGGPVLWMGPENRLQLVGIISYGRGCATDFPGVNTRVNPYIGWIISVTPDAEYCIW